MHVTWFSGFPYEKRIPHPTPETSKKQGLAYIQDNFADPSKYFFNLLLQVALCQNLIFLKNSAFILSIYSNIYFGAIIKTF